ncbi:polysaccharide deacetylase family protein [Oceanicola sp. D3]|uniref:polysaccharide deacetylase family protein n=1 Tax=Oceanicola sp. D3 TaxID=2587163 RepID=UPI00111D7A33|nr:polysaccharide deacetylase family protein [Oceanicola sp. D3]QDC07898.1 polysaccharide deacetylase family protein [Oceanicola sp. D3]
MAKKIRLSFDDGPKPVSALTQILKTLEDNKIIADFYVNGVEMEDSGGKAAVQAIHAAHHKVENHAFHHVKLSPLPIEKLREEVRSNQQIIKDAIGVAPTRLRPPYGDGMWTNPKDPELLQVAQEEGLTITLWRVDTEDWKAPMAGKWDWVMGEVQKWATKDLNDVLMHVLDTTARDLPELITRLKGAGYEFG